MKILRNKLPKIFAFVFLLVVFGSIQAQTDNKTALANFERSIESGKFEIERDLFKYVVANPNDAEGFSLLAKLRLKQNRLNEAKSLSNKALSLNANSINAKLVGSQVSFKLGEIEQAKQILNSISEKEILNDSVRLNLAQNLAQVGECSKALILVEKLPLKIKNTEALPVRASCYLDKEDKKNFLSLLPLSKNLAKTNPNISVQFSEILIKAGLAKEAVQLLRITLVANPKSLETFLLLARAEIFLKDFANAKAHLTQAEKLEINSAEFFFVKSLVESEQNNFLQAFDLLEKSLTLNSNNPKVLAQYVLIALQVNQMNRAFRAAEKLLNLEPENLESLYLYGVAALQSNNLQNAENSLTKFMEARPKDARGCLALGLTFAAQPEKLETARQQLKKCLVIDSKSFETAYQLGLSYKVAGDFSKAVEYFEQTLKISPNYEPALRELGAAYLQTNAETKARPLLEKAVTINPNDADAHFQLSRLYNLIGEKELAKKHLEIFQRLKSPTQLGM
ncbi:MAG: tetratricopeptide repeat protein [Pyrinomonadaceae bacterium]|nr:tetratricopeptide repeat protein [Pyrinomonadaceae bacterium]